ncbi:MAG: TPM domain-containing protein [Opitutus sp.]
MSIFASTPPIDHARVVAAISEAEQRTSGEVRVLVARQTTEDPVATARLHFERLGMTKTEARNGVLVYFAPRSRAFAIIGDTAVHEKCGAEFWSRVAAEMEQRFRRGEFTEGLVQGIRQAGELLAQHFPRRPDDRNELPDAIEGDL